jgi:outer membrane protein TolC
VSGPWFSERGVWALAAAGFLIVLSGCASFVGPVDEDRLAALRTAGVGQDAEARAEERLDRILSADNGTGRLDAVYGGSELMPDPDLGTLMGAALDANPTIGRAAEGIHRAEAERLNAIFGYLPQVSATLQRDQLDQEVVETDNQVFQAGTASYPVNTDRVQVTQPILDLSRIFGIRIANSARTRAEVEYVKSVKDITAEVFDQYVIAIQSRQRADFLQERLDLMDQQVGGIRRRIGVGEGQIVDLASMRSERGSLAAEIAFERTRFQNALATLSALSGRVITGDLPADLPAVTHYVPAADLPAALAMGLEENPAIMSAALEVVMADMGTWQSVFDDFAPVLSAYASLEREDREDSRFGGGSVTDDQVVGLRLTIPIFNASGRGYSSLTRRVDERIAVLEYFATRREVETGIRGAHDRINALAEAIAAAELAVRDAESALDREQQRVALGEGVNYSVLSRQVRLNVAQERRAFYQAEYLRAWGELQYLTGGSMNEIAG